MYKIKSGVFFFLVIKWHLIIELVKKPRRDEGKSFFSSTQLRVKSKVTILLQNDGV